MRKLLTLLFACVLFLSCHKTVEDYHKNPGIDLRFCNILTWTDQHPFGVRHNIFTYNLQGDPTSVTSDFEGTGAGYHYFKYDDLHRLTQHEHEFDAIWNYQYEGTGNRPTGTQIIDAYGREYKETFTWDDKNRITKVVLSFVSSPFEDEEIPDDDVKEFTYDANNLVNLDWNGQIYGANMEYTDKPSIYRTNKVWMLVNRNYSKYASTGAATYNSKGFPLTYSDTPPFQFPFLDMIFEQAEVDYSCKNPITK